MPERETFAASQGFRLLDGHDSIGDSAEETTCDVDGCDRWPAYLDARDLREGRGPWVCEEHGPARRFVRFDFDVTDLTEDEIALLVGEVSAQAEATDADDFSDPETGRDARSGGKPDVPYPSHYFIDDDRADAAQEA